MLLQQVRRGLYVGVAIENICIYIYIYIRTTQYATKKGTQRKRAVEK